ncbi:hypothetical protein MACH24_31530 [Erythrobacter sp. Dej080120_24]|uniref:hypothetical protein n=1 Tax=Erythrobacter sp. Dej080120_24 TaxID=3024837 RepID=UPI002926DAAD|nr:hypothetical protein MACH24_31530 [Erythrobacter sp. Dej080120_24]
MNHLKLMNSLRELKDWSGFLIRLAEHAPERLTLSQSVFFLEAAIADLSGRPATFTEIKEKHGGVMSRSLHTTYKVFLGEEGRESKRQQALGWLMRETDPSDNRRKYLRLTVTGRRVMEDILTSGEALLEA